MAIPDPRDQTRRTRCDFCYGYPRRLEYRLPEQYAKAVSDDDIRTVNTFTTVYAVVKMDRDDGSGIADLVLE